MRTPLLARQLRRNGLTAEAAPTLEQWQSLLATIERTYQEVEQDRYTLERSLAISSAEMRQLYENLKKSSESALAAEHAKLRKSVAIHEAILEAALDGVLVVDENRKVVSHSRRFDELWQDAGQFLTCLEDIHTSNGSTQEEIGLADGRVLDRMSAPIRGEDGTLHGRVWFFRDVTARKRQEDRIREANRFLDSIVENIPHMVFVKDAASLRFVRFNRAGERLLGLSRETLIGKSDHDLFPADQADFFVREDRNVLAQQGVVTIEQEPIETPLGTRWLRTKKIPIFDDQGTPLYLLGISEDITDALRKRDELLAAKETAEKASKVKSDFLLNMSHEMRTPLNAILGFARIIQREVGARLDTDQQEFVANIVHAGGHMLALVNDLLDLRSLEETKLDVAPLCLAPIIDETVALLQPLIDERGLVVQIDVASDLPMVLGNRRAVAQILINLLSNAAKFTPEGGTVTLAAVVDASRIHVSVKDTGIGIAAEDQVKLFTYFEQVGGKHAHHMKGSGVGLALTRALVERQGGEITVRSAPGKGSVFKFDLEVAA